MRRALWRSSLPEGTGGVQRREVLRAQGRLCGRYRDAFHAQPLDLNVMSILLPRLDLVRQPTSQPCKRFVPDLGLLFI
jgi:hypothetical protein